MHVHMGEIPPSFDGITQNKTRVVGRGREMVQAWGGGTYGVFFAHARPTLAVLWTFPHTFPEDTHFGKHGDEGFAKHGDEGSSYPSFKKVPQVKSAPGKK